MLDIHLICKEREAIEAKLKTKDPQIDLTKFCENDHSLRQKKNCVIKYPV